MRAVEFAPGHAHAERQLVHVLWLTSGLGCDGESVAMTAATSPSLEDLLRGVLPGMPRLAIYNPLLAYETGEEFVRRLPPRRRRQARTRSCSCSRARFRTSRSTATATGPASASIPTPASRSPRATWIDRLAPRAAAVLALGTCAAYGGIPAMRGNPTGAMGLRDYLGPGWTSRLGVPIVNLPGCPVQPDNITETLLHLALHVAGVEPMLDLDEQGRPARLFERTVQEGCGRAGFAEQGEFAADPRRRRGCLVKLGCMGPVVKCNVPVRGWVGGIGGCPNVGGHLHRLHDARLPGQVHAVHGAEPARPPRRRRGAVHLRAGDAPPAPARDPPALRRRAGWRKPGEQAGERLPGGLVAERRLRTGAAPGSGQATLIPLRAASRSSISAVSAIATPVRWLLRVSKSLHDRVDLCLVRRAVLCCDRRDRVRRPDKRLRAGAHPGRAVLRLRIVADDQGRDRARIRGRCGLLALIFERAENVVRRLLLPRTPQHRRLQHPHEPSVARRWRDLPRLAIELRRLSECGGGCLASPASRVRCATPSRWIAAPISSR